ncbi:hypothetical protein IH781_01150 [Patescibacteria group bacterium]|nr:hypothetical protein [Patescibacteria group bacterium]
MVRKKRKLDKNMKNRNVIYSSEGLLVIMVGVLVVVALGWGANKLSLAPELASSALAVASASPRATTISTARIIGVSTEATTKARGTAGDVKRQKEALASVLKQAKAMQANGSLCDRPVAIALKNLDTRLCRGDNREPRSYELVGKPIMTRPTVSPGVTPVLQPKIECETALTDEGGKSYKLSSIPGSRLSKEALVICGAKCVVEYQCDRTDT